MIAAAVPNDAARVSRILPCAKVPKPDSSQPKEHETHRLIEEEEWDKKTAVAKFAPFTEKELKT